MFIVYVLDEWYQGRLVHFVHVFCMSSGKHELLNRLTLQGNSNSHIQFCAEIQRNYIYS